VGENPRKAFSLLENGKLPEGKGKKNATTPKQTKQKGKGVKLVTETAQGGKKEKIITNKADG